MRTDLYDAFASACGFDHTSAFVYGDGEGFFDVDVFSGVAGGDGLNGVPVVGGSNDYGVDDLVIDEIAEVFVDGDGVTYFRFGFFDVGFVDVADGGDFHILVAHEGVEELSAAIACANEA